MPIFRPPLGPLFLSNNPAGYWTENVVPFGVHFGAFWEQSSWFWGPSQGHGTLECPFFGPRWVQFFCPITQGVIGQKKWFPLGSILEHSGCQLVLFRCVSVFSLCEGAVKEPQLVHSSPRLAGCQVLIDKPRSLHMCFCRVDLFWDKKKVGNNNLLIFFLFIPVREMDP